jgi:hypothetical protein
VALLGPARREGDSPALLAARNGATRPGWIFVGTIRASLAVLALGLVPLAGDTKASDIADDPRGSAALDGWRLITFALAPNQASRRNRWDVQRVIAIQGGSDTPSLLFSTNSCVLNRARRVAPKARSRLLWRQDGRPPRGLVPG